MKVVTGYTVDTPYEESAKKLISSLDDYDIDSIVIPYESCGDWVRNTMKKPSLILEALQQLEESEFLVWLDADSFVFKNPTFLKMLDF